MPPKPPMSGVIVRSAASTFAHRNSAVSKPSRPTAMQAVTASAHGPTASAASSFPPSSTDMRWEVRLIQKTIVVTRATATIDITPPKVS